MKSIVLLFDSLNRHMLPPYGGDWVKAPNFARLAARTLKFERSYSSSMPCMPARREMHTGQTNFLHRGWGPLEPFDTSFVQTLKEAGVHSHLATDHYHYFEEGGSNYHTRFNTYEYARGQEGDPWAGRVGRVPKPEEVVGQNAVSDRWRDQDWKNRIRIQDQDRYPVESTMDAGLAFLKENEQADNWLLQVECFDPHEPFFSRPEAKEAYAHHFDAYSGPHFDWPHYGSVPPKSEALVEHLKHEQAALITMCDKQLGRLLDYMDLAKLWDDTMLIVMTDHGILLGEHECWGKNWTHGYSEIVHTPFFVHDPRHPGHGTRAALAQPTLDLAPTILSYFGVAPEAEMHGRDLEPAIAEDKAVRSHAMFGWHNHQVGITDGRWTYLRGASKPEEIYDYTLMPCDMTSAIAKELLVRAEWIPPQPFTKGYPVMRIPRKPNPAASLPTLLFDGAQDPRQTSPIQDPEQEQILLEAMSHLLRECQAPSEQFTRLGL